MHRPTHISVPAPELRVTVWLQGSYFEGGVRGTAFIHGDHFISARLRGINAYGLMHVTDILPTIMAVVGSTAPPAAPLDGVDQSNALFAQGAP
jgi:arylsulfatase A-like enzyme